MGKNITIQEGGNARQFTASKLRTSLVGGGTCDWVPEDETRVTAKHITDNGTYTAADEGYYGYSEVTVSGVGTAVGRDSDGDEAMVKPDPQTGELVESKIPSRIEITTLPTRIFYYEGDPMNYSGLVVKAYLLTGELWTDATHPDGVIPISELILPVTVATYGEGSNGVYSNGEGINAMEITYSPHENTTVWEEGIPGKPKGTVDHDMVYCGGVPMTQAGVIQSAYCGEGYAKLLLTRYNGINYLARIEGDDHEDRADYYKGEKEAQVRRTGWFLTGGTNGRTTLGIFRSAPWEQYIEPPSYAISTINPNGRSISDLYQTQSMSDIPVKWARPGDGHMLEDQYTITVTRTAAPT